MFLTARIFYLIGLAILELGCFPFVEILHRGQPADDSAINYAFLAFGLNWTHIFLSGHHDLSFGMGDKMMVDSYLYFNLNYFN